MRHDGGGLIALGAGLGLVVAVYNFIAPVGLLAPESSVNGTPGAALVIASTLILLVAGLVLAGSATNRGLIAFLIVGSLLGILGTGLAAFMLDSTLLVALMAICLIGWLTRVFSAGDASA